MEVGQDTRQTPSTSACHNLQTCDHSLLITCCYFYCNCCIEVVLFNYMSVFFVVVVAGGGGGGNKLISLRTGVRMFDWTIRL